ncbi:MAG: trigger factor [Dorea sp.]
MKRKIAAVLAGTMALAMVLTGCQGSKGLETDEIKITQYKGVEVEKVEKTEVTDEDIDAAIEEVRLSQTIAEDRAVVDGDMVNIAFVGKMNGEEFDGGSSESYNLEIGSGAFIDGFEDSVIGHKVGETFDWNGVFPENYPEDMAGKDCVFTITVNSIIPELNDEFVKTVSEESATLEEYKEEMKKTLEENAEATYESTLISAVWEAISEKTEVLVYPEDEVEALVTQIVDYYKSYAEAFGVEYETLIEEEMGSTVEEFEAEIETVAKESIKEQMIIAAIAEEEKIEVDDATYEAELEKLATSNGYTDVEEFKSAYEEEDINDAILGNVVGAWLVDNCIQVATE